MAAREETGEAKGADMLIERGIEEFMERQQIVAIPDHVGVRLDELSEILAILEKPTYKIWTVEAAARGLEFDTLVHPCAWPAIEAIKKRRADLLKQAS